MTGANLQQRRISLELSQPEMALCLQTSLRTYEGWETRYKVPGVVEPALRYIETNPQYVEEMITTKPDSKDLGVII